MSISGIYKIQSRVKPERCYIGSAVNIGTRWSIHKHYLKRNKHHSRRLQFHFNKYGLTDLQFTLLTSCDKEDLITNEQFFIDVYNPFFNTVKFAANTLGYKHTEAGRRAISDGKKGRPSGNKGKHPSEEARHKMSIAKKGKHKVTATTFKAGDPRKAEMGRRSGLARLGKKRGKYNRAA